MLIEVTDEMMEAYEDMKSFSGDESYSNHLADATFSQITRELRKQEPDYCEECEREREQE